MNDKPTYEELEQGVTELDKELVGLKQVRGDLELHEVIMRNMVEGVCLVRVKDAKIVYANPHFENMFGYEPGELIGKPVTIVNYEDDSKTAKQVASEIIQELSDHGEAKYEVQNVKKDGTAFWCMAQTSEFEHPDFGKVWVAVHSNITEQRETKEALKKAHDTLEIRIKERTAELAKANKDLQAEIFERKTAEEKLRKTTHDLGERVKELNCLYSISKLVEKENTTKEEILQGTADLIPPSWQYPEVTCAQIKLDDQTYKTGNFTETEWRQTQKITVKGEKAGLVEIYYTEEKPEIDEGPFLKEERDLINAIAERLGHIIEKKQAEEALQKAHNELEQRVEERSEALKRTHEQLLHAEKLSAIGKMSASIAHEFNNPLYGFQSVFEGLKRNTSLNEHDVQLIDLALSECERVKKLIKDLQDFNKPSSGVKVLMDIHEVINDMIILCKKELKNTNVSIRKEFAAEVPEIHAVPDQIKQVLLNLLTNAKEVMEDTGGSVTVTTERLDQQIVIRIKDTGTGISPQEQNYIFEPFFTTKSAVKGTGLGLSISYGIIKSHGGDIQVESEPGKGTTFSIILPIKTET